MPHPAVGVPTWQISTAPERTTKKSMLRSPSSKRMVPRPIVSLVPNGSSRAICSGVRTGEILSEHFECGTHRLDSLILDDIHPATGRLSP